MVSDMESEQASTGTVIASGNLATHQRTITGVLGQLALLEVDDPAAREIFSNAGLPERALQEPDFPISLGQELVLCNALVRWLGERKSPVRAFFAARSRMGIESLGALGMAMRHATTALEALKVCMDFPQLTAGHSRLIVAAQGATTVYTFSMERPVLHNTSPAQIDRLVDYCLALDVVTSMRNIDDILDQGEAPLSINFPFPEPADWHEIADDLPCPVNFCSESASLYYPITLQRLQLPRANPLVFRSFVSIAEKQSLMMAEDIGLTERVTRWLWAYTPPLRRGEIASQLAMSERSLTRGLRGEGTSYAQLMASVQRERAENFLRNGALSVSDIGYRLGYAEPAAFTRAFKSWSGVSPLKWRKQH